MEHGGVAISPAATADKAPSSLENVSQLLSANNDKLGILVSRLYEVSSRALGPQPEEVAGEAPDPEHPGLVSGLDRLLGQQQTILNKLCTIVDRLETFC